MPTKPLSYPAPNRARINTPAGYITRPWAVEDVTLALSGGGFFLRDKHEFADRAASALAFNEQEATNG